MVARNLSKIRLPSEIQMIKDTVFCKDCKHAVSPWWETIIFTGYKYAKCSKSADEGQDIERVDVVTGRLTRIPSKSRMFYCSTYRMFDSDCGPDARFWVPKDNKYLFTYLKRI